MWQKVCPPSRSFLCRAFLLPNDLIGLSPWWIFEVNLMDSGNVYLTCTKTLNVLLKKSKLMEIQPNLLGERWEKIIKLHFNAWIKDKRFWLNHFGASEIQDSFKQRWKLNPNLSRDQIKVALCFHFIVPSEPIIMSTVCCGLWIFMQRRRFKDRKATFDNNHTHQCRERLPPSGTLRGAKQMIFSGKFKQSFSFFLFSFWTLNAQLWDWVVFHLWARPLECKLLTAHT